jgi:hypothetical protein
MTGNDDRLRNEAAVSLGSILIANPDLAPRVLAKKTYPKESGLVELVARLAAEENPSDLCPST